MLDALFVQIAPFLPFSTPNVITMARRSDSLSFEPTPAINADEEASNSTHNANGITSTAHPDTSNRKTKEVHFSPANPPPQRAQSVATTVPLLEPVSSASQLPRHNHYPKSVTSVIDMEAYIQQSRNILQTQRLNFDRERKVFEEERKVFDGERRLWNTERTILKAKILDLEAQVSKSKGEKRRHSNDSTRSSLQSFQSDIGQLSSFTSVNGSRVPSTSNISPPPVWERPENVIPASRVFSEPSNVVSNPFTEDHSKHTNGHLPSISENSSFAALEKEISPSSLPPERITSIPISIDQIDKSLDGIIIKSTALAPSFVAQVMNPEVLTPQRSPPPDSKPANGGVLKVGMHGLLLPLDEKLKLHAGHTPMAISSADSTCPTSGQSTEIPTPIQENPLAPVSTAHRPPPRPTERSASYFSSIEDDSEEPKAHTQGHEKENEDPELEGPLALSSNNEQGQSNAFLTTLDAKLMVEAKRYGKSPASAPSDESDQSGPPGDAQDDEGPKLRMKKSTNFGSVFGSNRCGNL